jgi:hypothetical protein
MAPRELSERARARAAPGAAGVGPAGGARERARRRLVATVIAIYLLALLEGAIRKYLVPELGQYVFFIRDPLVVYCYLLATRWGLWPRRSAWLSLMFGMAAFGVLVFALQCAEFGLDETRVILGIYGWRAYFLYGPLALLIGAQFERPDLLRFARIALALAVPIAVLVFVQFASPPGAAINSGVAEEEALQFRSVGLDIEHVRTNGTFTSPGGQQQYIATAFALLLGLLLTPGRKRLAFLAVSGAGTLTCLALSGSRGAMLQCALAVLFALGLAAVGRGATLKGRALWLPLLLVAVAAVLYPIVFPVGFQTFMTRWEGAASNEAAIGGVLGRAVLGLFHFTELFDKVPLLGYGLGYGGNASILLHATVDGIQPGLLVEADFSRQMVDLGPVAGLGYIAFRIALTAWLGLQVWSATRRRPDPMAMVLYSYVAYTVVFSQLTGQGSINGFGWLFTGLCLAACRRAPALAGFAATSARATAPAASARRRRPVDRPRLAAAGRQPGPAGQLLPSRPRGAS